MFYLHAIHQTPFWWRHFAKFPAQAASPTQQKGSTDSGHTATEATNPRWCGSATRNACESFFGTFFVLYCVMPNDWLFGAEKDRHIPSNPVQFPSSYRLEGENLELRILTCHVRKAGSNASHRTFPVIFRCPWGPYATKPLTFAAFAAGCQGWICFNSWLINGNFRILKWRYVTIFAWNLGLKNRHFSVLGTSNKSVPVAWPLNWWWFMLINNGIFPLVMIINGNYHLVN